MAYDKNIPDVLQLLRLDLSDGNYDVLMDTTIARYSIDGDYFPPLLHRGCGRRCGHHGRSRHY